MRPIAMKAMFAAAAATLSALGSAAPAATVVPIKIMPLGNSITEMHGGSASYRCWLWKALSDSGFSVDFVGSRKGIWAGPTGQQGAANCPYQGFDSDHEGHYGWEINELLYGADRTKQPNNLFAYPGTLGPWLKQNVPDIVLFHMGTNDLDRGHGIQKTVAEAGFVIDTLRAYNPHVTVLLAQLINKNPPLQLYVDYDAKIPDLAAKMNKPGESPVIVVNQAEGFNPATDLMDAAHPNQAGEKKMAAKWGTALEPLLKAARCTLTVSAVGSGSVEPAAAVSLYPLQRATLKAVPAPGKTFVKWRVTQGSADIEDSSKASTAACAKQSRVVIQALFSDGTINLRRAWLRPVGVSLPAGEPQRFSIRGCRVRLHPASGLLLAVHPTTRIAALRPSVLRSAPPR